MAEISIIATPIGNLKDISFRALEQLKRADFVLCEDTRVTRKLLQHYQIQTPTISYHQRSDERKIQQILEFLRQGKNLALVSDAGTPGISDPGNELINLAIKEIDNLDVIPIPGPSALSVIASVAGISMDKFLFLGFPPHKRKRKKFFEEVIESRHPVIIYESPYRILKTLKELRDIDTELNLVVGRELTKKFETIYRGKIDEVINKIQKDKIKGEFVIIAYENKKEK